MKSTILRLEGISHWFKQGNRPDHHVLHNISLEMLRGQFISLVGPSGCGKSTLLKMILGTHPPEKGQVLIEDKPVTAPSRRVGIVYQKYSLFPNLTALQNVALGPVMDQTSAATRVFSPIKMRKLEIDVEQKARSLLKQLHLEHAISLFPHEMSGGMQQRTAIAQALIMKPEILLLDEPFGALDTMTREECQRMLQSLYQSNTEAKCKNEVISVIMVTHELSEAILISDRVIALSQHWNWKEQGFSSCPGATVVYDCASSAASGQTDFSQQESEIKKAAFDPDYHNDTKEFLRYKK